MHKVWITYSSRVVFTQVGTTVHSAFRQVAVLTDNQELKQLPLQIHQALIL